LAGHFNESGAGSKNEFSPAKTELRKTPRGPGILPGAGKSAFAKPRRITHIGRVNVPNAITLARLFLTGVFVAGASFSSTAGHWIALVSFVIAAISDFLDGYLARRMGLVTPMGKLLDPLADKVLVCSAFVYLSVNDQISCPVWVTVLIMAREFLVTGLRQIAVEAGQVLAADRLGKWKTGLQLTYCITCLVWLAVQPLDAGNPMFRLFQYLSSPAGWLQPVSMWLALGLTLLSGWHYLWASRDLLSTK
jgi:CDP-diacylglycerol--glycerol-3-phosphate 3-phosphatidyltransferase